MKKRILTTTALVFCFMVCFAIVADISGKWTGTLKTPDGNEIPLTYTFKFDNGALKGTAESPQGTVDIANAKMAGDSISFTVPVNGTDIPHKGKVYEAADSISMDITFNDMKMHTTLKRNK